MLFKCGYVATTASCSPPKCVTLGPPFGGIAAQLNHIAVLLSIATLENAGFAIRYRDLLASSLSDYARPRFPFDYHTALSDIHADTRRAVARESFPPNNRFAPPVNTQTPSGQPNVKGKGKSNRPNKGKGENASGKKGGKRSSKGDHPTGEGQSIADSATPAPTNSGDE